MEFKAVKLCMFVLISAVVTAFVSPAFAEKNKDIAATINGEALFKEVFENEFKIFLKSKVQKPEEMPETERNDLKNRFLDNLITSVLLFQEAQKQGLVVNDTEVDGNYASFRQSYPEASDFDKFIKENNLTVEKIKDKIKTSLSIRALLEKNVEDKVSVDDKKVLAFYNSNSQYFKRPETVRARHILIKADDTASEADKKVALEAINDIKNKLDNGEKFEDLAKTHSACPSSEKGGDLGFFEKGKMVKPFEDAAFAMKAGDVSDVVKTKFGYHIIKVTDKNESSLVPLAEVREKISAHLKNQKYKEEMAIFIENLRKSAEIKKEMTF